MHIEFRRKTTKEDIYRCSTVYEESFPCQHLFIESPSLAPGGLPQDTKSVLRQKTYTWLFEGHIDVVGITTSHTWSCDVDYISTAVFIPPRMKMVKFTVRIFDNTVPSITPRHPSEFHFRWLLFFYMEGLDRMGVFPLKQENVDDKKKYGAESALQSLFDPSIAYELFLIDYWVWKNNAGTLRMLEDSNLYSGC
jgi:hypothetical protein